MNFELKKMQLKGKIITAGSMPLEKIYIAFSPEIKDSQRYAQILSKGIKELRKSGRLKEILSKYDLMDWKQ